MMYPIPWSMGIQVAVAIGINLAVIALLWWPILRLRWHYRGQDRIPFRSRLGAVIVFLLSAGIFWAAFLWYDQYVWNTLGREWIHVFLSRWTLPIDIASAIALPAYMYELMFSKNHRGHHHIFGKIMWIALWVIISLGVYLVLLTAFSMKGLVALF